MVQENRPETCNASKNGVAKAKSAKAKPIFTAKPFQRKKVDVIEFEKRFLREMVETMRFLKIDCDVQLLDEYSKSTAAPSPAASSSTDGTDNGGSGPGGGGGPPPEKITIHESMLLNICDILTKRWKQRDEMSEMTFLGLAVFLEYVLSFEVTNNNAFAHFVDALGYHTVQFWKKAVPLLYESDLQYGTAYRDALLFSLTLYDVNSGRNRLRELFAAIPGLRSSLMAKHAKRFEENFHTMMQRRGVASSLGSSNQSLNASMTDMNENQRDQVDSVLEALSSASLDENSSVDPDEPRDEADDEVERTLHASDGRLLSAATAENAAALAAAAAAAANGAAAAAAPPCCNGVASAAVVAALDGRRTSPNGSGTGGGGAPSGQRRTPLSFLFSRQRSSSSVSSQQMANMNAANQTGLGSASAAAPPLFERQASSTSSCGGQNGEQPETIVTGGLCIGHFQERVINVSNAPPVQLKRRRDSGQWEIGQGSGGLVSCCDPVMVKDTENLWLACFGPDVPFGGSRSNVNSPMPTTLTNSLGLPIVRPAVTEIQLSMLQEQEEGDEVLQEIRDQMSLMGVLRNYNKDNYKLNPVVVGESDYNTYYGGISNGLLWPAFHTLPEYIVKDYDDPAILRDHWNSYVRVNYQFALNAVRKSRPQDFLWIHDYHLILTGMIIQSLDANIEIGFFLHIPFQPTDEFFTKFQIVAEAVVRGLMRFTKVGFQTHLDRETFVNIVRVRFPGSQIHYIEKTDKHVVSYEGYTTTLGVFPVSIKNEDFLTVVQTPSVQENAKMIRQNVMRYSSPGGKFFFSVERFDYTKGIMEKINAYSEYFRRYPDRLGKDVFVQVAVTNRRSVDTYRKYQDDCAQLVQQLNDQFRTPDNPDWRPCIFLTDGLTRPNLVAHYLAMDVGVVTPRKDGMNLVAKEMIVCNPKASLVISCGAGTEQQLNSAGFYADAERCYHRVANIYDPVSFAAVLYEAAVEESTNVEEHGRRLNDFMMQNDIEKWSSNFLDPSWTHQVVQVTRLRTLQDFHALLFEARDVRRFIVERVLAGHPIRPHYAISLRNVRQSLEQSCDPKTGMLVLTAASSEGAKASACFDVSDEIRQLDIDLDFMNYVQSESYDNLELFLQDLSKYHPDGQDDFAKELEAVINVISGSDHFEYFFSDRDGTLRSYACTYASSIQGAYSGVIQATFARRCAQYAAIVTSAPLQSIGILDVLVMPEGYYTYGASCGREWYLSPEKRFKDTSIVDSELKMLEKVADKIAALLEKPDFRQFAWLGSGLQRHFGHVTVARQDVYKSIDEEISNRLFHTVCELVHEFDPTGKSLHVSDTETDIKIHLKAKLSGKTFTKGHGIRLFAEKMKLDLAKGNILVCGDSDTDLPMLQEALMINPQNVFTVWVTKNEELRQKVVDMCHQVKNNNVAFTSSPFVILGAMAQATIREIKIRPGNDTDLSPRGLDFDDNEA